MIWTLFQKFEETPNRQAHLLTENGRPGKVMEDKKNILTVTPRRGLMQTSKGYQVFICSVGEKNGKQQLYRPGETKFGRLEHLHYVKSGTMGTRTAGLRHVRWFTMATFHNCYILLQMFAGRYLYITTHDCFRTRVVICSPNRMASSRIHNLWKKPN